MDSVKAANLCHNVEYAATQVRTSIGDRTEIDQVLNRLWLLHDSLNRLIEGISDRTADIRCRKMIRTVLIALESPQVQNRQNVSGLRDTACKINSLLIRLEQVTIAPIGKEAHA